MTYEILQKIAKQHKINLRHFTEVCAWINEKYTYVFVSFAERENCGGQAYHFGRFDIKLSVSAIQKRGEFEDEYTTNGWTWISDIK